MDMEVVARCVRGIEWVAAAEAAGRLGAAVVRTRHREVWLRGALAAPAWTALRTVDDVFLRAGVTRGVGHTRNDLLVLSRATSQLDWTAAVAEAERPRGTFDVVGSFLGKRNYNRFEVEQAVGERVSAQTGWTYRRRSRDRSLPGDVPLTIRVHVEGDEAVLGIRLADRPLHRRPWKDYDAPGSLHPPVAAALGLVAGLRPGVVLVDPLCGAGTIGIEAALAEPTARTFMSDLSSVAVIAAGNNARAAGVAGRLVVARADAGSPPLRPGSVDRLVINPPWGRTVRPEGQLRSGWPSFMTAMTAVLSGQGRAVLLVDTEEVATLAAAAGEVGWAVLDTFRLSVSGAWVTSVVLAAARAPAIDPGSRYGPELAAELAARLILAPTRVPPA
jgi:tRNA (guanine6-N2)-methyltransferase